MQPALKNNFHKEGSRSKTHQKQKERDGPRILFPELENLAISKQFEVGSHLSFKFIRNFLDLNHGIPKGEKVFEPFKPRIEHFPLFNHLNSNQRKPR